MNYTKHEQSVIEELEKRAGDVLYFEDIAPFFISKSYLQISTFTQTAYIQVGDNMQNALSEYFQLVVFIKKMEENSVCFSIPYTPLVDNSTEFGHRDFQNYQQNTIADGDLLVQLFKYAGKKYVIVPVNSNYEESVFIAEKSDEPEEVEENKKFIQSDSKQFKTNSIIPSLILFLLFIFIGAMGYQSYLDNKTLKLKQEVIVEQLEEHKLSIEVLNNNLQSQVQDQRELHQFYKSELKLINSSLEQQNTSLRSIRYWNRRQFKELEKLLVLSVTDSIDEF